MPALGRGQADLSDHTPGEGRARRARVRVDREHAEVVPLRYISIHDVDRAVNPALIEDQMQSSVVQGVAGALRP